MDENMTNMQQQEGSAGGPAPMGSMPQESEKKGHKGMIITIIIILIIIVAAGIWLWTSAPSYAPSLPTTGETSPADTADQDTTAEINESLDDINLGDIESEFEAIDSDLQGL